MTDHHEDMRVAEFEERVQKLEAALNRYRYAVAYAAAESWDLCGETRLRFEWARALDPGSYLEGDALAGIGAEFRQWSSP